MTRERSAPGGTDDGAGAHEPGGEPTVDGTGEGGVGVIRVVVADDQEAVRAGIVMILSAADGIEVVGEAGDGDTAVALCRRHSPDVAVLDVRMPRRDGISATREIVDLGIEVVVLTTFDVDEYVYGALRAGAGGFLLKDTDAAGLVSAVRTVARGDGVIAPGVTRRLIGAFAATGPVTPAGALDAVASLTPRELDVLSCLGRGLSNQEIADHLATAESTAKTHVSRILAKLGLRSRVQAAILAQERGL